VPSLQTAGARLSYLRSGSGPAVLLIQGVGVVGEGWRPQIDELGARFDLLAFDNRGIGLSEAGQGELTIEAMASDALAIVDQEKIDRFHLVGHSMGGLIAQEVALRAPERISSLALLCTFANGKQGSRPTLGMLGTAIRTRFGTRNARRNAFLELVMPAPYLKTIDRAQLAHDLKPFFGHDLADQPPIVMKQLRAMSKYDAGARLAELASIRTLVGSAAGDRIALPAYGRALAAAIPGSRFVEIPEAGHGVTIQRASVINALLSEHFGAGEGASPATGQAAFG
jgi:pimeloyl-ACP methyl ester carboxylesterase